MRKLSLVFLFFSFLFGCLLVHFFDFSKSEVSQNQAYQMVKLGCSINEASYFDGGTFILREKKGAVYVPLRSGVVGSLADGVVFRTNKEQSNLQATVFLRDGKRFDYYVKDEHNLMQVILSKREVGGLVVPVVYFFYHCDEEVNEVCFYPIQLTSGPDSVFNSFDMDLYDQNIFIRANALTPQAVDHDKGVGLIIGNYLIVTNRLTKLIGSTVTLISKEKNSNSVTFKDDIVGKRIAPWVALKYPDGDPPFLLKVQTPTQTYFFEISKKVAQVTLACPEKICLSSVIDFDGKQIDGFVQR